MRTAPDGVAEVGSTIVVNNLKNHHWICDREIRTGEVGGGVESSLRKVWTRLTSNTRCLNRERAKD